MKSEWKYKKITFIYRRKKYGVNVNGQVQIADYKNFRRT